jgi:hypothetical protein
LVRHVLSDPGDYPSWKNQLRDGIVAERTAQAVAERPARIHTATAGKEDIAQAFPTDESFYAIRLEPYLVATGKVHRDLQRRLDTLVRITASTRRALVHGDVSPKNILIGPRGPVFIDAECAWYGDPAFDPAFCLNHLLLKCPWRPRHAQAYLPVSTWFARPTSKACRDPCWYRNAHRSSATGADARANRWQSPIEYVTDERDKDRVRAIACPLIASLATICAVRHAWAKRGVGPMKGAEIVRAAWP